MDFLRITARILFFVFIGQSQVFANTCGSYLYVTRSLFFNQTLDRLIGFRLEVYEEQQALVQDVHQTLRELTVPYRDGGVLVKAHTHVSTQTMNLLSSWASLPEGSLDLMTLQDSVMSDPYLSLLDSAWVDYRNDYLKTLVYMASKNDTNIPQPMYGVYRIEDYLNLHLRSEGPAQLPPYLVILRIMRDHDPNLNDFSMPIENRTPVFFRMRAKVERILTLQKVLYVLNRDIQKLSDFRYGDLKVWNQVRSLKDAVAEFKYLKRNIVRLYSYNISRLEFERLIASGEINSKLNYEDFLVSNFVNHNIIEESELARRFRVVKNIIRLATASQSYEELLETSYEQFATINFVY